MSEKRLITQDGIDKDVEKASLLYRESRDTLKACENEFRQLIQSLGIIGCDTELWSRRIDSLKEARGNYETAFAMLGQSRLEQYVISIR